MDISEIREKYERGEYSYRMPTPHPQKLPANHVFDVNLTIARNAEMIR